jgi:nicotinamide-nucleotide amidase
VNDAVNAEIVAIGTELLLGEITDTNAVYLAQQLRDIGINLFFKTTVGDNEARIESALRIAMNRADVIITSGGLGPTIDDMTRQSVASATDRGLVFHQSLLDMIAARFATFNTTMTENNKRQAYLPADAIVIENPVGTAPSFIVEHGGKVIISLPGVPREMKYLMTEAVIPYLKRKYKLGTIQKRNLKVAGIGESSLDDMIGDDLLNGSNPSIGLAAHHGVIDVRITAKADDEPTARAMLDAHELILMERIGSYVFGKDGDTLENTLVDSLRKHDAKLALLEAGIDDAIIGKLKSIPHGETVIARASTYATPEVAFAAYPTFTPTSMREFAAQVAQHIAQETGAEIGIAILTLPEVNESADNNEATAVAIYSPVRAQSRVYGFGGKSDMTRTWVSRWAMAAAWRLLREKHGLA